MSNLRSNLCFDTSSVDALRPWVSDLILNDLTSTIKPDKMCSGCSLTISALQVNGRFMLQASTATAASRAAAGGAAFGVHPQSVLK